MCEPRCSVCTPLDAGNAAGAGAIPDARPRTGARDKPAGRLIVGEIFIDPDFPRLRWLVKHADGSGRRRYARARAR